MKRFFVCALCALIGLTAARAQMEFRPLSLGEALQAAQAEQKLVFVDCYTEWCGPCKMMATREFVKPEAGEYFNPKFVCIKIDMEKGEGPDVAKQYSVGAFPTFLLLAADGTLRGRLVGAATMDAFIGKVEAALKEEKGLPWYQQQYKQGQREAQFLKEYLDLLQQNYMHNEVKAVSLDLLQGHAAAEIAADSALFKTFSTAGLTPYDSLFLDVYRLRATVADKQGERRARSLDETWKTWSLRSLKFDGKEYQGFDQEKYDAYLQLMADYQVPNPEEIKDYVAYNRAVYGKDFATLLKLLEPDLNKPDDQVEDAKVLRDLGTLVSEYKDKKAVKTLQKFAQRRIDYLSKKDTTGEREFTWEGKKTTMTGYLIDHYKALLVDKQ